MVVFVVLYGALIGSFLNAIIDRLYTGESIKTKRSHCDTCGHVLGVFDLVPVISWLVLRGRCRYCHAKIPFRNVVVELLTISVIVIAYQMYLDPYIFELHIWVIVRFVAVVFILCSLIVLAVFDMYHGILPDQVMVVLFIAGLIFQRATHTEFNMYYGSTTTLQLTLITLTSYLFYLGLHVVTKGRGMAMGDVKLAFMLGLILGFPGVFYAHYIAFLIGGIIAVFLLFIKRKTMKQTIPFGPFMVLGAVSVILFSDYLDTVVNVLFG